MKKWILIALLPVFIQACKSSKKKPAGEESITPADFIAYFQEVKPPYMVTDASLEKKKDDSLSISYKIFISMVPDTLLAHAFGKSTRIKFYPLGRITVKKQDTYLLLKALGTTQKAAFILVFDKNQKFVTGLPLLVLDNNSATEQSAFIDNKLSITTNTQHKAPSGKLLYRKAAYAYISSAAAFTLILTESNETESRVDVQNPIDTFPRKNKLSGDYRQNRFNLVSVRDSKKPGEIFFFIHFEQDEGGCRGELKGKAKIVSPGKALYHQPGDPCELQFSFAGNKVTIKEDGCGAHRDIKCFFEGSFIRKPPAKSGGKHPRPHKKV